MKFLRLHDPLLSVLFEDDDIIAIDKPYGFNAHTNDSKVEHSEYIQDGLIEIYEKNLGRKLHIIHRLDQTTTGVMIFGKSVDSAKKYAEFFFNRQVKKTYWFLTKHTSSQKSFLIDEMIVHKGRELDAETELTLIKRAAPFELWQANPHTGRNHQIRIHAKAAGIPILGDRTYDGAPFSFLCLHNHRIEFPNGLVIVSRPPVYFEKTDLLTNRDLAIALFESDRRQRLFAGAANQCFRLVHPKSDTQQPGFTVDQLGETLMLNWLKSSWTLTEEKIFQVFADTLDKPLFARDGSESKQGASEVPIVSIRPSRSPAPIATEWLAKENHARYELRTELGSSAGLSLNQRLQRNWVKQTAKDKAVLSLFANTGGFALAAALGGASEITAVEAGKRALNAARKNAEINELPVEKIKFYCRDSISFLEQGRGKGLLYDLVICEAPSFLKREKKIFRIKTDLDDLLKSCLLALKPKGELLFSTTFDGFFIPDVQQAILRAQTALKIRKLEINCILASMDFELPAEKTALKSFLIRLG